MFTLPTPSNFSVPLTLICFFSVVFLLVWHKRLTRCVLIQWMVPRTLIWCHRTHLASRMFLKWCKKISLESPVQVGCRIQEAWGWCTGMTQRDGMGKEVGGGFRMGNTYTPMADTCWFMAKPIQYCKVKNNNNNNNKLKKNASLDIYYSHSLCPGTTYLEQTWVKPKGKHGNSCTQPPSAMSKHMSVKQWSLFKPTSLGQWCFQGRHYLIWGCTVCPWSTPFYQNFKVSTVHPLSVVYPWVYAHTQRMWWSMEGDSQFEILDDESKTNSINFQEKKKIRERYLNPLKPSNLE